MPRRISPSQFRSQMNRVKSDLRRAEQKVKQAVRQTDAANRRAVNDFNRKARAFNQAQKNAISQHNQKVRSHNARVIRSRQSLQRELTQLRNRPIIAQPTLRTFSESTFDLHAKYEALEQFGANNEQINELARREAANSLDLLDALTSDPEASAADNPQDDSDINNFLAEFSTDLHQRWRGAVYALNPENPDAARHFCTSVREIFSEFLDTTAPDDEVENSDPNCEMTQHGKPTRRAKIVFLLRSKGIETQELTDLIEADISNITQLFGFFNKGTHGPAGRHSFTALKAIKSRVQDGLMFLASVTA